MQGTGSAKVVYLIKVSPKFTQEKTTKLINSLNVALAVLINDQ